MSHELQMHACELGLTSRRKVVAVPDGPDRVDQVYPLLALRTQSSWDTIWAAREVVQHKRNAERFADWWHKFYDEARLT